MADAIQDGTTGLVRVVYNVANVILDSTKIAAIIKHAPLSARDVQPLEQELSLHPLSARDVQPHEREHGLLSLSARDVQPLDQEFGLHPMSGKYVLP